MNFVPFNLTLLKIAIDNVHSTHTHAPNRVDATPTPIPIIVFYVTP